jgi:hypothetical protein
LLTACSAIAGTSERDHAATAPAAPPTIAVAMIRAGSRCSAAKSAVEIAIAPSRPRRGVKPPARRPRWVSSSHNDGTITTVSAISNHDGPPPKTVADQVSTSAWRRVASRTGAAAWSATSHSPAPATSAPTSAPQRGRTRPRAASGAWWSRARASGTSPRPATWATASSRRPPPITRPTARKVAIASP